MKKSKIEAVDKTSYYNAFNEWLNASTQPFNLKDETFMNEKWLSFATELGVSMGGHDANDKLLVEVEDVVCWKEAKKYYSIISHRTTLEEQTV